MSPRSNLNRNRVVEKAIDLANTQGWEELNLHKLSASLSIKPPSLYNHVKSLKDLKYAMSLAARKDLVDQIKNATVGKSGSSACRALATTYLQYCRSNPGLLSAISTAPDRTNPEDARIDDEFLQIGMALLSEFPLNKSEKVHALRAIRCTVHGFAVLEQHQGFGLDTDVDASFEWMIRVVIDGFNPGSA